MGCIWSSRVPNPSAFISTMKSVWTVKYRVEIVNIGKNLYQIQFFHWQDKERIMEGQPWHFDKYPLLLEDMDKASKPSDMKVTHLPMWVRFYDIPFKGRGNEANAKVLGDKVGSFMEWAKPSRVNMDKSLRVRVKIDVRNPLVTTV